MDEDKAAQPPASPQKPPSARVVTAMPVTTLRKRNKWDGGRLQPRAQVIGGGAQQEGATIAMSTARKRDVASTLFVKDVAGKSVRGYSSP